jgi:hypothetical protein
MVRVRLTMQACETQGQLPGTVDMFISCHHVLSYSGSSVVVIIRLPSCHRSAVERQRSLCRRSASDVRRIFLPVWGTIWSCGAQPFFAVVKSFGWYENVLFWHLKLHCYVQNTTPLDLTSKRFIALMIEAAGTSESSVNFHQTPRRYNPEDSHLSTRRRENRRTYILVWFVPVRQASVISFWC